MLKILAKVIFEMFRLIFKSKRDLILENLALRQLLAIQQRNIKRPKIKNSDHIFEPSCACQAFMGPP
jgi:hypothetical protein